MKVKSIILSFLFTCLVSFSFAQLAKIRIEGDWGRPRHDCTGFGICGLRISVGFGTLSEVRLSSDQGTVIMDVPLALTKGYEKRFSGSVFQADEEYQIPSDICKALGAKKQLFIRAGKHDMKKTEVGYTIYFKQ